MSNRDTTLLRQQILKLKQTNQQQKELLDKEINYRAEIENERDCFLQECEELREQFKQLQLDQKKEIEDELNKHQKGVMDERQEAKQLRSQVEKLKKENDKLKESYEEIAEELRVKKQALRIAGKDPKKFDELQNYRSDKQTYKQDLDQTREDLNNLRAEMQNILAENRVLKKLADVPDNYGFDLEKVKAAEQEKMEDFKQKVRQLEGEVEELEKERARLRSKLRSANLFRRGKGQDNNQMAELDEYDEIARDKIKDENERLRKELESLKNGGMYDGNRYGGEGVNKGHLDDVKNELKDHINTLMANDKLMLNTQQFQTMEMETVQGRQAFDPPMIGAGAIPPQQQYMIPPEIAKHKHHGMPPSFISGRYGDADNITNGNTNRFGEVSGQGQKVPVDLYDLYNEGGFDTVMAKQEIATLQLMNIENIKIIQEKEREYDYLYEELQDLKENYTQMLLIQDKLFEQHYTEKQKLIDQNDKLHQQNDEQRQQLIQTELRIKSQEADLNILQGSSDAEKRERANMISNKAILEVNLIELSRKYECKKLEYEDISEKYIELDKLYAEKEEKYVHRIQELLDWKKRATVQLRILLQEQKNSVPFDVHKTLEEKFQDIQGKYTEQTTKFTEMQAKLGELKGKEREVDEKNDIIHSYQEEMVEMNVEFEIIKKRLQDKDTTFKRYQECFDEMIKRFKQQNVSPLEAFKQFDENGDGKLSKPEFAKVLKDLDVNVDDSDINTIFMFMDLDGSDEIEYNEFLRRMRRAGIAVRREEEQIVYKLYQKIVNAGWKIRDLFTALDKNYDNNITKDELKEGFYEVRIDVTDKEVDFIFKMADISRDGQINYDEFRALFENVLSDSIRDEIVTNETELDPKKEIILKIDESIRDMGYSLLDIYKIIDQDEDQKITIKEFQKLFNKIKVTLPRNELEQLFQDIDKDRSSSIQYNELLAYIRAAKKEQAKIDRMKKINARVEQIKNQSDQDMDQDENEKAGEINVVQRMQMKMTMLELREKNQQKRLETQKRKITQQSKEISGLEMKIEDLEAEIIRSNKNYYETREIANKYEEKIQSCINKRDSEKLSSQNNNLLVENSELKAALTTFKSLYMASIDHVKVLKLTDEKRNHQKQTMHELMEDIKDVQATSDNKALVGKLYHQLMISRWQQGEINKKYDKILEDSRVDRIKIQNLQVEVTNKEEELEDVYSEFKDMKRDKEGEIQVLKGKVIPTVSLHRIEELHNRLSEIVQQKLDLEITNRKQKEINNELQLRCDYLQTSMQVKEEVDKALKDKTGDSHSQVIVEQGKMISELKLAEMKAKRDAAMAREKEEYYQRINRQNQDMIKVMESEIANNQTKFNEREEFWRKRAGEAQKLFFKKQEEKEKEKQRDQEDMDNMRSKVKNRQGGGSVFQSPSKRQSMFDHQGKELSHDEKDIKIKSLEEDLHGAQEEILKLREEKQDLESTYNELKVENSNNLGRQTRVTKHDKQDVDQLTKKAIDEESQKFMLAAQKTIQTLQELINEKNEHLANRDRLIEKMRKDFAQEKEKDIQQIRELNNKVVAGNLSSIEKMRTSIVQHNGQVVQSAEYWGDVGHLLHEKDQKIEQIEINYKQEIKDHKRTKKQLEEEQEKSAALEGEIVIEKKRNETGKLMQEIEKTRKLYKQKESELVKIKGLIKNLKDDQFKMAEEKYNQKNLHDKVIKEDKSKIQQMEQQLKDALEHVKKTQMQISANNNEVEEMRQKSIQQQSTITDLQEENRRLKGVEQPSQASKRKSEEEGIKNFISGGKQDEQSYNTKTKEQETKIKKLEDENKELKSTVGLLQRQVGQQKNSLINEDGYLQGEKMEFSNLRELLDTMNRWSRQQNWDIMENLKKADKNREGIIKLDDFYTILKNGGIVLKPTSKKKIENETELVDYKKRLNLVELAYMLKPRLVRKTQEAPNENELNNQSSLKKETQSQLHRRTASGMRRDSEVGSRDQQDVAKLQRKLNIVDKQLYEAKREKEVLEKQMQNWKDKAIRLEKELNNTNNNPRLGASQKRASTTQSNVIGALKDEIYGMEDKNEKMKMQLYKKDVEIQKLGEEKAKLEEEVKYQKLENNKTRGRLDDYMGSRMGQEQLKRENESEKDIIIRNLKGKLEEQRQKDEELTDKYYDLVSENKELNFVKENFDIQVERLQRRIVELEEYKKLEGGVKDEPVQQSTLKKGYGRKY